MRTADGADSGELHTVDEGIRWDADPDRLNVHGGAIALGHALGASGTKLMVALGQRRLRYSLQTMCEGGGMANVTIIERV